MEDDDAVAMALKENLSEADYEAVNIMLKIIDVDTRTGQSKNKTKAKIEEIVDGRIHAQKN